MKSDYHKLSAMGLGTALGLTWAISMFIIGMAAMLFSYGMPMVTLMESIYIGFHPTLIGSLIGMGYGFVDGFIGGVLIAWFYNLYGQCCSKKEE